MSIGLKDGIKRIVNNKLNLRCTLYEIKIEIKYALKRLWLGYDDKDIYDFDLMFKERTIILLEQYKKTYNCLFWCPDEYEIGNYNEDCDRYVLTKEQSNVIIDTIIFHLKMSDNDYVEEMLYDKSLNKYQYIESIRKQNQDMAMDLLKLFLDNLWE